MVSKPNTRQFENIGLITQAEVFRCLSWRYSKNTLLYFQTWKTFRQCSNYLISNMACCLVVISVSRNKLFREKFSSEALCFQIPSDFIKIASYLRGIYAGLPRRCFPEVLQICTQKSSVFLWVQQVALPFCKHSIDYCIVAYFIQ